MNPYAALYLKELKSMRLPAAALLVGTAVIVLSAVASAGDGDLHAGQFLLVLPYLCPPLLAGLLIHSVASEWNAHTQHQWLALPLPHAHLLLTKVAAVLSLGAAVLVISTSGVHYVHERVIASLAPMFPPLNEISPAGIWATAGSLFTGYTIYLVGLACLAVAVRAGVTRFHAITTVGVFLLGIWLSSQLQAPVADLLATLGIGGDPWTDHGREVYAFSLHRVLMGLLYGAVGVWWFERRLDA